MSQSGYTVINDVSTDTISSSPSSCASNVDAIHGTTIDHSLTSLIPSSEVIIRYINIILQYIEIYKKHYIDDMIVFARSSIERKIIAVSILLCAVFIIIYMIKRLRILS